jgi:hypothetical protein
VRVPAGLASALLVALCLLAPAAQGQAPPSPAPAVDISGETERSTVSVAEARVFTFTVRNGGQTVPGAEEQSKADVTVSVEGVPAGWTVGVDPSSFELAPGASQAVKVQVQVAPEADAGEASLTVKAVLVSPFEGLEPILGQVPGASQTATDSAPLSLTVQNSLTRDVVETLGPWIYAILLLLVAAVVVAIVVSVSSRRAFVRLSADDRERTVAPGGKVAFSFRVESLAREADTVILHVSAVQDGWAAFLPVPELAIEPGQPQDVTLVVIAPPTAEQGARQAILVTATSAKSPKGAANLEFVAVVQGLEDLPTAARRAK